jgi:translation elongation factor EF-4
MDLERERGITIKVMQSDGIYLQGEEYQQYRTWLTLVTAQSIQAQTIKSILSFRK